MFDSKSPVLKIVGYFIIGFFGLIIIVSFGMPDFLSRLGVDNSIAAIVNGKKIQSYDYFRFRDRYREILGKNLPNKKQFDNIIFNNFIGEIIMLQKVEELGFDVSDDRILRTIKEQEDFRNSSTGKYDPERLKLILRQNSMSLDEFFKRMRNRLLKKDLFQVLEIGLAVPSEEISSEYKRKNSKIRIKYAFISTSEINKRFKSSIDVTDKDIDEEMNKNLKEMKDPKTDKQRIKRKLIKKKLDDLINNQINKINTISKNNGSFNEAAAVLNGKTGYSEIFKIGDNIKERGVKGKSLVDISNSRTFRETCLILKKGNSSKAIKTFSGIYIFTPIMKIIASGKPSEKDYGEILKTISDENLDILTSNLMTGLSEKSKVTKYLKTN